jgi:hypothetical protein
MAVGDPAHAIDEEQDDAEQDEGVKKDEKEAGKVAANEAEKVIVPAEFNLGERELGDIALRGSGKKEHYCGISDFSELTLFWLQDKYLSVPFVWMRRLRASQVNRQHVMRQPLGLQGGKA